MTTKYSHRSSLAQPIGPQRTVDKKRYTDCQTDDDDGATVQADKERGVHHQQTHDLEHHVNAEDQRLVNDGKEGQPIYPSNSHMVLAAAACWGDGETPGRGHRVFPRQLALLLTQEQEEQISRLPLKTAK